MKKTLTLRCVVCLHLILMAAPAILAQAPASQSKRPATLWWRAELMRRLQNLEAQRNQQTDPQVLAALQRLIEQQQALISLMKDQREGRGSAPAPQQVPIYVPQYIPLGPAPYQQIPLGTYPYQQIPLGAVPYQQIPLGPGPYQQIPIGPAPQQQIPLGQPQPPPGAAKPIPQAPLGQPVPSQPPTGSPQGRAPRVVDPEGQSPIRYQKFGSGSVQG